VRAVRPQADSSALIGRTRVDLTNQVSDPSFNSCAIGAGQFSRVAA
jgi:hypothetical protein